MQAIQGVYENGRIKLDRQAPADKARVIVLFTEETQKKMSADEALRIFHKHAGSVKTGTDLEGKKDEYFNEKHGTVN